MGPKMEPWGTPQEAVAKEDENYFSQLKLITTTITVPVKSLDKFMHHI